ncbi:hypothetical protein [uncultured Akkermansia sp.]|uniref:hypothetical protein n=1 Tax=uncultured Akkermansia sp. TaxID=512294 RepID=UPI00260AC387|nr:hypothetical protein [uncultured Akkermansia sp.]
MAADLALDNGRLAISASASSSCGGLPLGGGAVQGGISRPPVGRQEIGTGSLSEEIGLSGNLKADYSPPPDEKGDGWWPVRSV